MSVRPLNKRFALIVALYNCRKRDYSNIHLNLQDVIFQKDELFYKPSLTVQ